MCQNKHKIKKLEVLYKRAQVRLNLSIDFDQDLTLIFCDDSDEGLPLNKLD